jgi:hypothetical protein
MSALITDLLDPRAGIDWSDVDPYEPINRDRPWNQGLVSLWLAIPGLNDGGLTFYDLAGTRHGTLTSGPQWDVALGRDGSNGSIRLESNTPRVIGPTVAGNRCTYACWIRHTTGSNYPEFLRTFEGGANDRALSFGGSSEPVFRIYDGATKTVSGTSTPGIDVWRWVAGTADGTTIKVFHNGVLEGSAAAGTPYTAYTAPQLDLGVNSTVTAHVDHVATWDRDLSESELWSVYEDSLRGCRQTLNWRTKLTLNVGWPDAGGGTAYNETGAGNITIGGSAAVQVTYSPAASGGASLGGSALPQVTNSQAGAGGIVTGGAAVVQATYNPAAAGGAVLAGAGQVQVVYGPEAAGGVVIGGAAELGASEYSETGSGGAVLGGSSLVQATYSPAASGGVVIAGSASLGNQEFNETGSGGAAVGGAADVQRTSSLTGAGGVILSGTAAIAYVANVLASGGAAISGVAIVSAEYGIVGEGGVVLGGVALVADFISVAKFPGAVRIDRVGLISMVELVGPRTVRVSRMGPGKVTVSRRTL